MPNQTQASRIALAIQATRNGPNRISQRAAAKLYDIPLSTLNGRINGAQPRRDTRHPHHKLNSIEERVLHDHIIDLDTRGMPPNLAGVEDMANLLAESRGGDRVGKHWVRRFIDRNPNLKTKMNRKYDHQRALCEDPGVVSAWFALVANIKAIYGILDEDMYNFGETDFMMGVIGSTLVVTRADRRGKAKSVQPGNREWATAIECINSQG